MKPRGLGRWELMSCIALVVTEPALWFRSLVGWSLPSGRESEGLVALREVLGREHPRAEKWSEPGSSPSLPSRLELGMSATGQNWSVFCHPLWDVFLPACQSDSGNLLRLQELAWSHIIIFFQTSFSGGRGEAPIIVGFLFTKARAVCLPSKSCLLRPPRRTCRRSRRWPLLAAPATE